MASTSYIILLRHGETEGGSRFNGSTDVALTEHGWSQMRLAVKQLAVENKIGWNRIISSPLSRCAMFAQKLKQQHTIPLHIDARIKEIHFGEWEGRSAEEIFAENSETLTRYWQDPIQHTPTDAEPLKDFERRVLTFWQETIKKYQGEKVLLIAHGGVIRLLLCHIQRWPLQRLLEIEVAHASIHMVCIEYSQQEPPIASIETTIC